MKKILVLLLLAAIVAPAFADDALVLPKGVLRTTIAPAYSFTTQQYDTDGKKDDLETAVPLVDGSSAGVTIDKVTVWALNFALEYGITDQINIAAQWGPGWQFAGNVTAGDVTPAAAEDAASDFVENAKPTGLADLFLGAKTQILGPQGYVPNDMMRFAAAAGFIVPLNTYDPEDADENAADDKEYQRGRVGNDTYAAGFRLYYDYIITEGFFWNLYTEAIFPFARDLKSRTETGYGDVEVKPGYELTFETEPDYGMMVGNGMELGASLPLTYKITGEDEFDGDAEDDSETKLLTIGPTVSFFMSSLPVPTELSLSYNVPLYGEGVAATNSVLLQIKNFLRF